MKKGYIMVFVTLWIICIFLVVGVVLYNLFVNSVNEENIKISEKNEIMSNTIQIVTTATKEVEKETIYIVKENKGYIAVYILDENGKEQLREITQILTKYLPESDKEKLQIGIRVIGREELNKVLEDYE